MVSLLQIVLYTQVARASFMPEVWERAEMLVMAITYLTIALLLCLIIGKDEEE